MKKHSRSVQIALRSQSVADFGRSPLPELQYRERVPQDVGDYFYNPSYSKFHQPYYVTCRNRIAHKEQQIEDQLQRELLELLEQQPNGYEAARFVKHLALTTLWPPYHTAREIQKTSNFFKLTPKERTRLNYLMVTKII